jgi:hypothetical protein
MRRLQCGQRGAITTIAYSKLPNDIGPPLGEEVGRWFGMLPVAIVFLPDALRLIGDGTPFSP